HRYTGLRYPFVDADLMPVSAGVARGQIAWLAHNVRKVDPTPYSAAQAAETAPGTQQRPATVVFAAADRRPIAQFLETHDVRSVVGQYVRLNQTGVGHCPWGEQHKHGDRHPSFAVFARTQKWWCFTERVGGNAFDFLCRYHGLEPGE